MNRYTDEPVSKRFSLFKVKEAVRLGGLTIGIHGVFRGLIRQGGCLTQRLDKLGRFEIGSNNFLI